MLFYGLNGVGKTNALDAIHHLCLGKGYVQNQEKFLFQSGTEFYRIVGGFESGDEVVVKNAVDRKKTIEYNHVAYEKMGDHVGKFPVIMITPDDICLVNEGDEYRRRFVDMAVAQLDSDYLNALSRYKRILAQRNQYLKQSGRKGRIIDMHLLQSYDEKLENPANVIFEKRSVFFESFNSFFQQSYNRLSGAVENVSIQYISQLSDRPFSIGMAKSFELDKASMRTSFGIHKDKILISMNGIPLRKIGSQGQRKTAVFALKLGLGDLMRAQNEKSPILLLDDLFDKLDANRIERILQNADYEGVRPNFYFRYTIDKI